MNTRIFSFLFFAATSIPIISSCKKGNIILDKVYNVPGFIYARNHFGNDIKSMEERNHFILITGIIDTTSEKEPEYIAIIQLNKRPLYLKRTKENVSKNKTEEKYEGEGYELLLNYEKVHKYLFTSYIGEISIRNATGKSVYSVEGVDGYR